MAMDTSLYVTSSIVGVLKKDLLWTLLFTTINIT